MSYSNLRQALLDLEKNGMLRRIPFPVDPHLEMAAIHRRVFQAGGPAIWYEQVKGSKFSAASNLFGHMDRCRFLFRDSLKSVKKLIALKRDPAQAIRQPLQLPGTLLDLWKALPRRVPRGPVQFRTCRISDLPAIVCAPNDGGPFVTLPQVYTEDPFRPGPLQANLGMYRIQLSGNRYVVDQEVGLHYQIHRGIGVHQQRWKASGQPMPLSIFVGGPPAHTLAAVMPLPEGLSELPFGGVLGKRRWHFTRQGQNVLSADADFVICGTVKHDVLKPEGPFADHLGYYSLEHDFPVLTVAMVWHRKDAVWPFTVVGRPPQEDSCFGELIHELTGDAIQDELPGVRSVHAVDASGVHPLLFAVGSERYTPYTGAPQPSEMLTQANRILGTGQLSLAKYLFMACDADQPPSPAEEGAFLMHLLERVRFERDVHFQTSTSIDTLDYSGEGLNRGSKMVLAALGKPVRRLRDTLPEHLTGSTPDFVPARDAHLVLPGIVALSANPFSTYDQEETIWNDCCANWSSSNWEGIGLLVLCDDAAFCAASLQNFLWVTFTRSNPSHDVYGIGAFTRYKHWGCRGPLIIDARIKPFHAPPIEFDPEVEERVDQMFAPNGPLADWGIR